MAYKSKANSACCFRKHSSRGMGSDMQRMRHVSQCESMHMWHGKYQCLVYEAKCEVRVYTKTASMQRWSPQCTHRLCYKTRYSPCMFVGGGIWCFCTVGRGCRGSHLVLVSCWAWLGWAGPGRQVVGHTKAGVPMHE